MGAFSWRTADTDETIWNNMGKGCKTTYLLAPNGAESIKEVDYDGYGRFGGIDAYEWLAKTNLPELCKEYDTDHNREIGIMLESNNQAYRDTKDDSLHSFHFHKFIESAKPFSGNYGSEYKDGLTYNDAIDKGILVETKVHESKYPLKFSFSPHALYEALPPSKSDQYQGHWGRSKEDVKKDTEREAESIERLSESLKEKYLGCKVEAQEENHHKAFSGTILDVELGESSKGGKYGLDAVAIVLDENKNTLHLGYNEVHWNSIPKLNEDHKFDVKNKETQKSKKRKGKVLKRR